MTLLKTPLLLLFSILTFHTVAQNIDVEITGQVFLHNSMDKYGKIEYIRDAEIKTLKSKSTTSDRRGQFKLKFKDIDPEKPVFLNIMKNGYEVVDERNLQYFLIDGKTRLRVFLAEKGYVRSTRTQLIESALKAHNTEKERLLDLLEYGGIAEKAAFKTIEERTGRKLYTSHDAKSYILQMSKEYLEKLSPYSYELAIVNPDFASDTYIDALDFYYQSDPEEAVATLQEEDLDKSFKDISGMIKEVKGDREQVKKVIDSRFRRIDQIKNNYIFQVIGLQQYFRFKEADQVLEKLARINQVVPSHKCSLLLQDMRAFDVFEASEPDASIVLENPSKTITAQKEQIITKENNPDELAKAMTQTLSTLAQEKQEVRESESMQQEISEVESYSKPTSIDPSLVVKQSQPSSTNDILSDKGNNQNAEELITKVDQVSGEKQEPEIVKKDLTNKSLANASIDDFENILFFSNISAVELITVLQEEQNDLEIMEKKKAAIAAKDVIKRDKLTKTTTPIVVEETKPEVIIYTTPEPIVQRTSELLVFSDIPESSFYKITKRTSLRRSPNPKAKILKRLAVGTEMEFLKKIDKYWYKVRMDGRIGYVKSYRLKKVK